jgi:hypothetical protein
MKKVVWIGLIAAATLASCGQQPSEETPPSPSVPDLAATAPEVAWRCENGQNLKVTTFADPDYVMVKLDDGAELMLPPAETPTEAGKLYQSDVRSLFIEGDSAQWRDIDTLVTSCARA